MKTQKFDKISAVHLSITGQLSLGAHIQIGDRVWRAEELAALLARLESVPAIPEPKKAAKKG
jgi:hypothetical protein